MVGSELVAQSAGELSTARALVQKCFFPVQQKRSIAHDCRNVNQPHKNNKFQK